MRVLVAYASRHGATAEIAEAIGDELRTMGIDAEVHSVSEPLDVLSFDAVILGSAVYNRKWLRSAVRFGKRHAAELNERHVWLFHSGEVGSTTTHRVFEGTKDSWRRFGTRGDTGFFGRLRPEDVGLFSRRQARRAAGPGYMFGDWRNFDSIRRWARAVGTDLQRPPAAALEGESLPAGFGELARSLSQVHRAAAGPLARGGPSVSSGRPAGLAPSRATTGRRAGTVVTEEDLDSDVFLDSGESVFVHLMESPEYGFRWAVATMDPAVLYLRTDSYVEDPDPNQVGGVLRNFEFVASRRGKCKLKLKLWDESIGDESIEDEFSITVHVH